MRKLNIVPICLLTILLLQSSCKKFESIGDIEVADYEATFAVPLINSKLNLQDALDRGEDVNNYLSIDNNGDMTMVYEAEVYRQSGNEMIEAIPDFPFLIPEPSFDFPFTFFDNITVDEMQFKSGTISFKVVTMAMEDVHVIITFPDLMKDGEPFKVSVALDYSGALPTTVEVDPISLEGYMFGMSNGKFNVKYEAYNGAGDVVELTALTGETNDWTFSYLKGNWAREVFDLTQDTIDIDFFKNYSGGMVSFADPRISLIVDNSYGFPVSANFDELKVMSESGNVVNLESNFVTEGFHLNFPPISAIGSYNETVFDFNNSNSNITDLLGVRPTQLIYDVNAIFNPENNENMRGFLTDSSGIVLSVAVEMPIYGSARGFEIEEPIEVDFSDLENVVEAEFKLLVENTLPVETNLQIVFLDASGNEIDQLFEEETRLLQAAGIDANGVVIQPSSTETIIPVDAEKMNNIRTATQAMLKAQFSTSNQGTQNVRIRNTQGLDVKLGAIATVRQ